MGDYLITSEIRVDAITEAYLIVAGYDRSTGTFAELWDLASGELVRKINSLSYPNFYSNEPYCKSDTDVSLIACGSSPLQIFDVQTGKLLVSNKSEEGYLEWAISPDGNLLATCTVAYEGDSHEVVPGGQIYLLDLTTPSLDLVTVLEGPQGKICSPMVFSSDSQSLVAQSGYIWSIGQQQPQASFSMNGEAPMAFNPDGSLLVSGNWIIHADTGEKVADLEVNGAVEMIGFDADGYKLVIKTGAEVEVWGVGGD